MSYIKKTLALATAMMLSSSFAMADDQAITTEENTVTQGAARVADANGFYDGAQIFVSDKVNALLRVEPASNVRSIGVLHPGDQVIFRGYNKDKRFAQIESNGKVYWMRVGDLQSTPSAVNQVAALQSQVDELKAKIESLSSTDEGKEIENLKAQVQALSNENNSLKQALGEKDSSLTKLQSDAQQSIENAEVNRQLDMQMRWWLQGALIALGGAIVGIIFIMLPRPRRQRQSRY